MGFNTPDQATLEQYRNEAEKNHRDYWAQNGGSPNPDSFFPGFEKGWHNACDHLSSGNDDLPGDQDQWAKEKAAEAGQPEDGWEWQHGHKSGAKAAKQAGAN